MNELIIVRSGFDFSDDYKNTDKRLALRSRASSILGGISVLGLRIVRLS